MARPGTPFQMTPARAEILSYLRGLIMQGKSYSTYRATVDLKLGDSSLRNAMLALRRAGMVHVETCHIGGIQRQRVGIDGLGWTPWPDAKAAIRKEEKRDFLAEEERLAAERARIECERMERRQQWLAREFRGKGKGPFSKTMGGGDGD